MEIQDEVQIEIFYTLEKIERMNRATAFHLRQEAIDEVAVMQYMKVKADLTKQLLALLATMDVRLQVAS
jgi:hypothetical protein